VDLTETVAAGEALFVEAAMGNFDGEREMRKLRQDTIISVLNNDAVVRQVRAITAQALLMAVAAAALPISRLLHRRPEITMADPRVSDWESVPLTRQEGPSALYRGYMAKLLALSFFESVERAQPAAGQTVSGEGTRL
jgi:hypothetical protein